MFPELSLPRVTEKGLSELNLGSPTVIEPLTAAVLASAVIVEVVNANNFTLLESLVKVLVGTVKVVPLPYLAAPTVNRKLLSVPLKAAPPPPV